jgi:riboflavin kinase/FMN adenylyltransferase
MAIHTLQWNVSFPVPCRGGAGAIGNFDGVHRGHLALLQVIRRQAQALHGPAVVLTFDPHPLQLLHPESFQPVLTTARDRGTLLLAGGADHVVLLRTTPELLLLSAEQFFHEVLQKRLAARALAEGHNFGFGRNREGTIETLATLCRGARMELEIVPPVLRDGTPISSSRVRRALQAGAVSEAAQLLQRPYRLRGRVATGRQRGRTLGFPTANLVGVETLVPGDGVYAVQAYQDGHAWPGAANIGPNPTFGEDTRKVEVHLIGFDGDLLGQVLEVDFLERLRATRPFAGAAELVEQLRLDVMQARQIADASHSPKPM